MARTSRWLWTVVILSVGCAHQPVPDAPAPAPAGRVVLVAGGTTALDGIAAVESKVQEPFGVAQDRTGNLYVVEARGNGVRRIDRAGVITRVAGTGARGDGGDGGPALQALFAEPHHLLIAPFSEDVLVADTRNNRVRRIDVAAGTVATLAGRAEKGFAGDGGPATEAQFNGIYCMAVDPTSTKLYLADTGNRRIRVVNLRSGIVSTLAGNGHKGVPRDGGDARSEPLFDPRAVAADSRDNVYILERGGHALRVVDGSGKIRTVAGTGVKGPAVDGVDAITTTFDGPKFLSIDRADDVLIVDTENHVVRKYLPRTGRIVRIAGTGVKGAAGIGGPPEKLELNRPHGAIVDADGAIVISDSDNDRVVKIVY